MKIVVLWFNCQRLLFVFKWGEWMYKVTAIMSKFFGVLIISYPLHASLAPVVVWVASSKARSQNASRETLHLRPVARVEISQEQEKCLNDKIKELEKRIEKLENNPSEHAKR